MKAPFAAFPLVALLCLACTGAGANTVRCGGDAFSSAEVVGGPDRAKAGSRRAGPVTASPDTLCADLSDDRPVAAPNIDVVIGGAQGQPETGDASQGATPSSAPQRRSPRR